MAGEVEKKNKDNEFDREAFKRAIAHVESSGGKHLENSASSAAGKYHFLYRYIKGIPELRGVTKREFINRPELQEKVMDMALDGKLKGYPNYIAYASELKNKYKTDLSVTDLAAITHFLGKSGAKNYLSNPGGFNVPGKNASVQQYISRFRSAFKPVDVQNNQAPIVTGDQKERAQGIVAKDATVVKQPRVIKTQKFDFKDSGEALIEELNLESINQNAMGGSISSHGAQDIIPIENGGTHEQNPYGGVPMGVGQNGKMNTVEEGEVKFGDYIFSNRFGLGGPLTSDNNPNTYENGGDTDPKKTAAMRGRGKKKESAESREDIPSYGPHPEEKPLEFTKSEYQYTPGGGMRKVSEDFQVKDLRARYSNPLFVSSEPGEVNFKGAISDESAEEFFERYNDPWTREKLKEQANLSDEDIDNMILRGLTAKKQVGGNVPGSKASFNSETHTVHMGEEHEGSKGVETHERVHASLFDAAQGENLMEILGNPFQQKTRSFLKKYSPDTLRYLRKPHEAYGNFTEFREKLGLKPGEQINQEQLKKKVKAKGLDMENFYRAFDEDKIIKALNTIAEAGPTPSADEYRLA